ncbi:uncharacterized protein [Mobula birostris]|uniref:uncharacterized protein isoform X2 n=1 Tax=Mobula birostris TaxID=1983395 RepID=UPI003B27C8CE
MSQICSGSREDDRVAWSVQQLFKRSPPPSFGQLIREVRAEECALGRPGGSDPQGRFSAVQEVVAGVRPDKYMTDMRRELKRAYELAEAAATKQNQRNKRRYDQKVKFVQLLPGDRVLTRNLGLQEMCRAPSYLAWLILAVVLGVLAVTGGIFLIRRRAFRNHPSHPATATDHQNPGADYENVSVARAVPGSRGHQVDSNNTYMLTINHRLAAEPQRV